MNTHPGDLKKLKCQNSKSFLKEITNLTRATIFENDIVPKLELKIEKTV
jgi:hypothetical protein